MWSYRIFSHSLRHIYNDRIKLSLYVIIIGIINLLYSAINLTFRFNHSINKNFLFLKTLNSTIMMYRHLKIYNIKKKYNKFLKISISNINSTFELLNEKLNEIWYRVIARLPISKRLNNNFTQNIVCEAVNFFYIFNWGFCSFDIN